MESIEIMTVILVLAIMIATLAIGVKYENQKTRKEIDKLNENMFRLTQKINKILKETDKSY